MYQYEQLDEDRLQEWAEFCEECFSYKRNSPSAGFFLRKVRNDPFFLPEHIVVALTEENEIVGTARLFVRFIIAEREEKCLKLKLGGIGEVCTSEEHRKQGISSNLLAQLTRYCEENDFDVSSLHAAEKFRPFYERQGWNVKSSIPYSMLQLNLSSFAQRFNLSFLHDHGYAIELGVSKTFDEWESFNRVYSRNFLELSGHVDRTETYWREWVHAAWESKDSTVVQVFQHEELLAYFVIARKGMDLTLIECAVAADSHFVTNVGLFFALFKLARNMEVSEINIREQLNGEHAIIGLRCPSTVVDQLDLNASKLVDVVETAPRDDGWMYRFFDESIIESDLVNENLVVWDTDGF